MQLYSQLRNIALNCLDKQQGNVRAAPPIETWRASAIVSCKTLINLTSPELLPLWLPKNLTRQKSDVWWKYRASKLF
jgi:hypothetical protein